MARFLLLRSENEITAKFYSAIGNAVVSLAVVRLRLRIHNAALRCLFGGSCIWGQPLHQVSQRVGS